MQEITSVRDADVKGKRVLLRVDFNVPLDYSSGRAAIVDDSRIRVILPTIELVGQKGAQKIILLTHLGRPEGEVVENLRIAPIRARLGELIDLTSIELRENLRFDPREEANDPTLAKELAGLGDIFVNEAFADSHREHASTVGIAKFLPSFAGLRFMEEIEKLSGALKPASPSLAIIGGAKFETKEPLIEKLLSVYDKILLGGALGNDLLKARGLPVGSSLISGVPVPVSIAQNERIVMPLDVVVESGTNSRSANTGDVRADERIVDVGAETAKVWAKEIAAAGFVLWNGPMGVYEKGYTAATDTLAQALVGGKCHAVIGGGDTAAALRKISFDPSRIFISTGGGAMLQFLANGTLPGIEALKQKSNN